jgi:D-3-phosphoglycerate dehydrogenase
VIACSRTVKDLPGVSYKSLDEVLSESDIVSLHVPQNASTIGMISAEKIALMKKDAILINCARGPIVDSQALADALNAGRIAGAGIDVYEMEPPVSEDHPLLHAKNTVCTPHVAFASNEAMEKRAVIVCRNLKAWLDGAPENVVS